MTEQKKVAERLEESENRYRTLIELGAEAGEAIVMVQDIDGKEGIQTFVSDQWPQDHRLYPGRAAGYVLLRPGEPRDRHASHSKTSAEDVG